MALGNILIKIGEVPCPWRATSQLAERNLPRDKRPGLACWISADRDAPFGKQETLNQGHAATKRRLSGPTI
jgi:hypothetical protein